jgi:small neutral amino acid transporter SnatA (MarC family)
MMPVLGRAAVALALSLLFAFGVAAPPEHCPAVTTGQLRSSAQAAVDWFGRNQHPDRSWLYRYVVDEDAAPSEYNPIRHAGVTMALYQAAAMGLPRAEQSADRGTEWALDRLLERDGWAAVELDGAVPTGASALLAAGLVIRRETTGDTRYDELLRRLGRFLLTQTEPSGAVLAFYDRERGRPVPGVYSKYFTGEAYVAFTRLDRAFPRERWGEAAARVGTYLATSRDDAEGHWPPVPDHWAAYGMAEHFAGGQRGPSGDEVSYARRQSGLFGVQVRWISQRFGPWGVAVRGTYEPGGGGYGVIGEGLTGWWLLAREEPGLADLREPLARRATCIAALAVSAQSDAEDAAGAARPGRVKGAWIRGGETRMDDQQHALAALLRTIPIVASGEGLASPGASDPDDEAPSAWLWAAALLLALNPARAVFGVPRGGRSPRDRAALAAIGGAMGAVAVCAAAAAGEPLLEALDVSAPSFRIAAGVLAAVLAVGDLWRGAPAPKPGLGGRRAALVPVAVPLVARPVLLVLALGAGADQSIAVTAAALVAGVALLTALTAWCPADGPRARALRWAARLLAAGLLACGAILTIDGVLDV